MATVPPVRRSPVEQPGRSAIQQYEDDARKHYNTAVAHALASQADATVRHRRAMELLARAAKAEETDPPLTGFILETP